MALLERIIEASTADDALVLDPFCGCGTAVHAAEKLGRRWVGIDVSAFSVGLVRGRILDNFSQLTTDDVLVRGIPVNAADAEALAKRDKFEFEKWVCGAIGAEGMFHDPGTPGSDGGVDGLLRFYPLRLGKKAKAEFAIVQVKGGGVTPDAVRALKTTVDRFGATAGVMVCFNRFMRTVENQRAKAMFRDDVGSYPVIQGLSIEDLLADKRPDLPLFGYRPQGGRIANQAELLA
jgi:site-specific DNA-methyltransferase (adenine-specific)